jgi:hypothetical protein
MEGKSMYSYLRKALPFYVFALSVLGLLLIPSLSDTAHAQCAVQICKSAPELSEGEVVFFPFKISFGDIEVFPLIAANGNCLGEAFGGDDFQIEEEFFPGWILEGVECSDSALINVTFIENGVSLDCLGGTEITCTFTNVRGSVATNVPTLSEWGMIAAAGGLALIGVFFAVRRKRAFNS